MEISKLKLNKPNQFDNYIIESIGNDIDNLILTAEYTTFFNRNVKRFVNDIEENIRDEVEINVLFDTNDEIAIINTEILSKFIYTCYKNRIQEKYSDRFNVPDNLMELSEEEIKDYIKDSYHIIYITLNHIYKNIKINKDAKSNYIKRFELKSAEKDNVVLEILTLSIMENICNYLNMDTYKMLEILH